MLKKFCNYFVICAVAIVSVMMLSACSDDKDETQSDSIVGKWKTTYVKGWEKENGTTVDSWSESIDSDDVEYYEFKSNGKFTCSDDWDEYEGRWSYSEGTLSLRYDDDDAEKFSCSVSGDKMVWSNKGKYSEDGDTYEWYEEMTLSRISK
ncbi:MAG: lipocalin family protein [Bacteroidales bacterium]|nr:lipocalin family protein [Bacteroidales bacterium]MBD5341834.1 lipocalin family protein [Bacteroides sp.]